MCLYAIPMSPYLIFLSAGFLFVRDSIKSVMQIGDIKSHLDKKRLQKDVKDICSRIAKPTDQ